MYRVFHNDTECDIAYPKECRLGLTDKINEARKSYRIRMKEDSEREAMHKEKEAKQLHTARKRRTPDFLGCLLQECFRKLFNQNCGSSEPV